MVWAGAEVIAWMEYVLVKVSIVIPSRERPKSLRRLLHSFLDLNSVIMEWDVHVIGDRQSCWSQEYSSEDFYWLKFSTCMHGGPAAARNMGARQSAADWIIFVDDDCVVPPNWLRMWEKTLANAPSDVVQIGGPGYTLFPSVPYSVQWYLIKAKFLAKPVRIGKEIECIPTLNTAIRRDMFNQIGGFDPTFTFAGGEDSDLTFRLRKLGSVTYELCTYLYHDHSRSFYELLAMYFRYGRGIAHHIYIRNRAYQAGMFVADTPYWIMMRLPIVAYAGWRAGSQIRCENLRGKVTILIYSLAQALAYQVGGAFEMYLRKN